MSEKAQPVKKMSSAAIRKRLAALSEEQLRSLILEWYAQSKSMQWTLSFYFGDEDYRDSIEAKYENRVYRALNPSETRMMKEGINVPAAQAVVSEYESVVFTGNKACDGFYKAKLYLYFAQEAIDVLDYYGGGSDELYSAADEYFSEVCRYIISHVGKDPDYACQFYKEHLDRMEAAVDTADACGEGLGPSMMSILEAAREAVGEAYDRKPDA